MSIIIDGTIATPAALGTARPAPHGRLTFADAFDLGVSFLNGHGLDAPAEVYRRAVQEAHLDIINAYDWPSLEQQGRIHLRQQQTDGTVLYSHDTRLLTLSGATWPAWVSDASVLLNGDICEVAAVVDDVTVLLHQSLNPGADLAAGTSYRLFRRWYPLPVDFVNFTGPMGRNSWAYGQPISLTEMYGYQQNYPFTTGSPQYYAIGERPNQPAEKAIYLWPFPAADEQLDFTYNRRPREPVYSGRDAGDSVGTITVTADSNAVTGSSTAFEADMAGSLILIGRNSTAPPTGRYGLNRYAEQRRIHSVTSVTALALTENVAESRAGVRYIITDPIDVETCAQNAFMRYVEQHLAQSMGLDKGSHGHTGHYVGIAEKALLAAMAASYPHRYDPTQDRIIRRPAWEGPVTWGGD